MKTRTAILGGLIGGLATTALGVIARAVGIPVNLELLLGTMVVATPGLAAALVGFGMHMVISAAIAVVYAIGFEHWARRGGWTVGLAFSLVHTAIAGIAVGLMPFIHPRVPEALPAPGPYLANLGVVGVGYFVLLHAVYGMIVGAVYGELESESSTVGEPERSPKVGRVAAGPDPDAGSEDDSAGQLSRPWPGLSMRQPCAHRVTVTR